MEQTTKRNKTKENNYPIHKSYREINSVLRDKNGYMIIPIEKNNKIIFQKTSIKDIKEIKPNEKGQRGFNKKYIPFLQENIIDNNYKGDLYAYCIHEISQSLRPIDDFTFNNNGYPHTKTILGFGGRQPFCKESKRKYVNAGPAGNSSRIKDQFLEDTGSRFRTKIIESISNDRPKISFDEIYKKFEGKCFKCKCKIAYNKIAGIAANLDHTLPHSLYYPYTTENSTLLCVDCNQSKKGKWPSEFYSKNELKTLSKLTSIPYLVLSGPKQYNIELIEKLDTNFLNVIKSIDSRFRKRTIDNKVTIFRKIKKDMVKISEIHPTFLTRSNKIIKKINSYIKAKYNTNE